MEVAGALKAAKLIYVTNDSPMMKSGRKVHQVSVTEAEEFFKKHKAEISEKPRLEIRAQHQGLPQRREPGPRHRRPGRRGAPHRNLFRRGRRHHDLRQRLSGRPARHEEGRPRHSAISSASRSSRRKSSSARGRTSCPRSVITTCSRSTATSVGCVALHLQNGGDVAELACLSVNSANENMGIGQKLMLFAENAALERGV